MLARTSTRFLSRSIMRESAQKDINSFKSFAEYREFIVKKDPETLKARHEIMFHAKHKRLPDSQAELASFKDAAKKVAYK
ncbi:hypothetical protein DAMA08_005640 [Martiniozyma asiatica (nom. inval.)]|nr:hypothetical protein DAMA08_005640 [Martiniozyma asiatica]